MRQRLWRVAWPSYLVGAAISFGVLEWAAYKHGKHPTLSRELRLWLRCESHPGAALIFVAAGLAMAHHLVSLKELPVQR